MSFLRKSEKNVTDCQTSWKRMRIYTKRTTEMYITGFAVELGSDVIMWSQRNQVYKVTCGLCHGIREEGYKLVK
jgi:hypothetical protein